MKIFIDADGCPVALKEILFRAAQRLSINLVLVANQQIKVPSSDYISTIVVSAGPDIADDRIVQLVKDGDLVITGDIPLADSVIQKGAFVIDHRGELLTEKNIKERLAMRDLFCDLRDSGIETKGPSTFSARDRQSFANQLDRFLTSRGLNSNF